MALEKEWQRRVGETFLLAEEEKGEKSFQRRMKKEYRLKKNSSFKYIFRNGKRSFSELFILYYVKAKNVKLGVSVSTKIGNSVVRNKVKRRIKEAFNEIIHNVEGNYNFVIVAKERIATATYKEIKAEIIIILLKEKIYANKIDKI